jgi:hypothetical protein
VAMTAAIEMRPMRKKGSEKNGEERERRREREREREREERERGERGR